MSDWRDEAACKKHDPDLFFPCEDKHRADAAIAICGECPVRAECFAYALSANESGVWGGVLFGQRLRPHRKPKPRRSSKRLTEDESAWLAERYG